MKSTAKILAATGAAALVLAACGGDGGSGDGGSGDLAGEGTGADCTIADPVPVGAAFSLTGGAGSYGASQKEGLELAAEHLNEVGGVTYDVKIEDDQSDPRQGITVMEDLASDRSIVLGPTLSNTAVQAMPIAQENKMPVMGISTTADGITDMGDYVFRDSLTERAVIPQTVEAAVDHFGIEKVVVMYSNDDAFTESGYQVFADTLEEQGVEVASTLTFSKSDTDFRSLLTEASNQDPDAIVVSGLIEAAIPLVTQARDVGLDVPIIGGNGFNNPQLIADAGEAAEDVVVGAAWNSASEGELNQEFLAAYEEKYGSQPDQFAAQAYAALTIVDAAVRAECSGEREAIKDGLNGIEGLDTVLGTFNFSDERDAEHEAVVQIIQDGTFAVLGS